MNEGQRLHVLIRQLVSQRVPVERIDETTELVALALVSVLSDPAYFEQLSQVQALRQENAALRQHLAVASAYMNRMNGTVTTQQRKRKAPAKKAPAKKAPVRHNPPIAVKGSTAANRRAFKQGFGGRA